MSPVRPISDAARQRVRAAFAQDMIDRVLIQRGDPGTFDPVALSTTGMTNATEIYHDKARVTPVSADGDVTLGEGEIPMRSCTIQIPWDAPQVILEDVVTIEAAQDPQLVDTAWRVTGVDGGGSWAALRKLTVVGWYPSELWDGTS